jgi:cytochrome c biogenesis protein CcmG/thiol:disulfide interchange protein DsbE
MKRLKLFIPFVVFLVLAIFFWRGLSLDPNEMPSALIDKSFPEFQLPELKNGQPINREGLLGRVALVNVWASWCAACKFEHPVFNALSEQGIRIVGINYKDNEAAAKKWLKDLGDPYTFNIVDRQGTLGIDLGVFGAPETYLIDKYGVIRHKHVGIVDMNVWNKTIKPLYEQYSQ